MRWLDVLLRRTPPDRDRARRVNTLEAEAQSAVAEARTTLADARRRQIAAASDDVARTLREQRR